MRGKGTHSSKRIVAGIAAVFVLLIGGAGLVAALRMPQQFSVSFGRPGAALAPAPVRYEGQDGKNALELLKSHVRVTTQQSSYGEYVDTVNGVPSGEDGKYWALYVNGKQTPVAAGNVITRDGDRLEWKFE